MEREREGEKRGGEERGERRERGEREGKRREGERREGERREGERGERRERGEMYVKVNWKTKTQLHVHVVMTLPIMYTARAP